MARWRNCIRLKPTQTIVTNTTSSGFNIVYTMQLSRKNSIALCEQLLEVTQRGFDWAVIVSAGPHSVQGAGHQFYDVIVMTWSNVGARYVHALWSYSHKGSDALLYSLREHASVELLLGTLDGNRKTVVARELGIIRETGVRKDALIRV